ncbi:MAG: EscU/YscU/HrcU family type III secretion system export apparatus switch protein, partial [Bdellovibrionales bacterium]|nr:EscU/YscU/HrcU family type III secretion system export apparatus switch protein [Bdellovibrionales bacterium]
KLFEHVKGYLEVVTHSADYLVLWNVLHDFLAEVLILIFVPLGLASIAAIGVGLLQTKFLFRSSAVTLRFGRLLPYQNSDLQSGSLLFGFFLKVLGLMLSLIGAGAMLWFYSPEIFSLLNQNYNQIPSALRKLTEQLTPLFVGVFLIASFFGWLISRYSFMMRHRMTRSEIEAEEREALSEF